MNDPVPMTPAQLPARLNEAHALIADLRAKAAQIKSRPLRLALRTFLLGAVGLLSVIERQTLKKAKEPRP